MSPKPRHPRKLTLKHAGLGASLGAIAVLAVGAAARSTSDAELARVSGEAATPTVRVVRARPSTAEGKLLLPAEVVAWNTAAIHARTNGYVERWMVNIGDRVSAGQTLAVIDAPELDEQLAQARAELQTAAAEQRLASTTADRWRLLLEKDAVSRQAADEKAGALAARTATMKAAQANVQRLQALKGFTRLTAPFDGVVTSRTAEIGALVTSGPTAPPLFTLADTRRMRIFVRAPQADTSGIRPGLQAELRLPEYPDMSFPAVVTRTAGAVDRGSGTMLVELQAENALGRLKPGAYAEVALPAVARAGVVIPASALILGPEGVRVAAVAANGTVALTPVRLGRDEGRTVEVVAGLNPGVAVISAPPDALRNGDQVRVIEGQKGVAHAPR